MWRSEAQTRKTGPAQGMSQCGQTCEEATVTDSVDLAFKEHETKQHRWRQNGRDRRAWMKYAPASESCSLVTEPASARIQSL